VADTDPPLGALSEPVEWRPDMVVTPVSAQPRMWVFGLPDPPEGDAS
jgi:hypothetical protein